MKSIEDGVTAASGFLASGVRAGIKRSRKLDMALVRSDAPAVCAGTLTINQVKAAPVVLSQPRVRGGSAIAVLLNSGCANCMTGPAGLRDAWVLGHELAKRLGCRDEQVLVASTGIIGRRLPVARMRRAIPALVRALSQKGHRQASLGILTTDTVAKEAAVQDRIDGELCTVGGMAKGAGMIAPGMATMLCVITTDAAIDRSLLQSLTRDAVEQSFNRISIDGDMSTNDTVFVLANGRSGVAIRRGSASAARFSSMLAEVMQRLARLIIQDGEGATRVARVEVMGARTDGEALACARQVANSSLVRTMLASGDPNVGRIAAAAGASSARFEQEALEVRIDGHVVVRRGAVVPLSKTLEKRLLAPKQLTIQLNLHAGRGASHMLMCDLTEAYVRLNARYAT